MIVDKSPVCKMILLFSNLTLLSFKSIILLLFKRKLFPNSMSHAARTKHTAWLYDPVFEML